MSTQYNDGGHRSNPYSQLAREYGRYRTNGKPEFDPFEYWNIPPDVPDVDLFENVVLLKQPPCLIARLRYAERGWLTFPANLREGAKKSHKSAGLSNGVRWGASNIPAVIRDDCERWPEAGVGLPTGPDNGIFVIEADTPEAHPKLRGKSGFTSIAALEAEHGKLPDTLMAMSPSGSVHRYYRYPKDRKVIGRKLCACPGMAEYVGVDIQGYGKMVIAPPSKRPDGVYRWVNNLPIAGAPRWLLDIVCKPANKNGSDINIDERDPFTQAGHANKFEATSLAEVDEVLALIPHNDDDEHADDYWKVIGYEPGRDYMVMVGHAIKGACGDDYAAGLKRMHIWRSGAPDYYEDVTTAKYKGFDPRAEIGMGTLVFLANAAYPGWRRQEQPDDIKHTLFQTSAEFVPDFIPPDYLIDGLLQRRFVYSMTGRTGDGKTAILLLIAAHVAHGLPLAGREVERGRVLFFAGENPDDVRTRWIKLCEEMQLDPDTTDVVFMPYTLDLKKNRKRIDEEATKHGPFSLLIVDTSAAYFIGDDENNNVQLGNHARMLRTFIDLPDGPTVLVTAHPAKNPDMANLIPVGGGAFLNAIDGNLVCIKNRDTMVSEVTWHGKFRGPEFTPFAFRLIAGQSDKLIDSKGRRIWTVFAQLITAEDQEAFDRQGLANQNYVLHAMLEHPGYSFTELAEHLQWRTMDGRPNKSKIQRVMNDLTKAKLTEKRRDGRYVLTNKGQKEAQELSGEPVQKGGDTGRYDQGKNGSGKPMHTA